MEEKLQKSIDRAIELSKHSLSYDEYISIKLSPPSGCCCCNCLPYTWNIINNAISPFGPVEHEGDVLIEFDGNEFVLESHETGIEFIVACGVAALLLKPIADLIIMILNALPKENKKQLSRIK